MTVKDKRAIVQSVDDSPSLQRQCDLIGLSRSTAYYRAHEDPERAAVNNNLMRIIDEKYTAHPNLGRGGMTRALRRLGHMVNPKKIRRLMRKMGLEGVCPRPRKNLSAADKQHKKYPYLLRNLAIERPDQVWCADITYIQLQHSHMYLVAIMDWHSRYVIHWELSNSLEGTFCVDALKTALDTQRRPEIFNTDQGSQFTSMSFIQPLEDHTIRISMDGRGRALDNVMVERLWRTVKYDNIYLREYTNPAQLRKGLQEYFTYYNTDRPHSSLNDHTPEEIYKGIFCIN